MITAINTTATTIIMFLFLLGPSNIVIHSLVTALLVRVVVKACHYLSGLTGNQNRGARQWNEAMSVHNRYRFGN
jgi:hypothetical protein